MPDAPTGERHRYMTGNEIALADIPLRLNPSEPMRTEMVNLYPRKQNQGPPGPDDHPINSTWIMESWLGGGQVKYANPANHADRFDWAHASTDRPRALTLPLRTVAYDCPDSANIYNPIVMGDYPLGVAGRNHVAWGPDIYRWDEDIKDFEPSPIATMSLAPVGEWTIFTLTSTGTAGAKGTVLAFIPQGTSYQIFNGTGTLTAGTKPAIDFAVWDSKLFRLDATGQIDWTLDGTTWQASALIPFVPDGSVPRSLVAYHDGQREPILYLVTDGTVYALDFEYGVLRQTDLYFPRHPFQGTAAEVWRATLYSTAGIGVHAYQPGVISPVGLDRDDSMPPEYRGYISSMEPTYNDLLALVSGIPNIGPSTETATLDLGGGDEQLYVSNSSNNAVLMAWNGVGWHYRWHKANATPTNVRSSQAENAYRLWWGAGGQAHTQLLPVTYYNPRDSEGFEYEETGYYETPWWDWGWASQLKLAKKIELETERCTATETITVSYKLDNDANGWHTLGTITTNGEHEFFLGDDISEAPLYSLPNLYRGVVHERIKLKFEFARAAGDENVTLRPILKWHTVVCRKFLRPQRTWKFLIDCTWESGDFKGQPNWDLIMKLEDLVLLQQAVTLVVSGYDEKVWIVDVAAYNADINVEKGRANIRFNLIESNEAI